MSNAQSKTPQAPSLGESLYHRLVDAGCVLDHHESDLYVKVDPTSTSILRTVFGDFKMPPTFVHAVSGARWYDVAFMYEPFWEARTYGRRR